MMRKFTVLAALAVVLNITHVGAQNAPVTDCDILAADPDDPHRNSRGVSIPYDAVLACETAVRQYPNDARLAYQLARSYYAVADTRNAIGQFSKAAEQGYAPAQNSLGVMYETGRGVSKDETQAVAWYRKAAEQGNEIASTKVAGLGQPSDQRQFEVHVSDALETVVALRETIEQGGLTQLQRDAREAEIKVIIFSGTRVDSEAEAAAVVTVFATLGGSK